MSSLSPVIKLLGRLIGRKLEKGSTKGAFVGAFLGLAGGVGLAYALWATEEIDSMTALAIAVSTGFMLAGALLGSVLGPRAAPDDRVPQSIRLTNFNRGLVPMFFVALSVGLYCVIVYMPQNEHDFALERNFKLGCIGFAALALLVQSRKMLWVEVGPSIILWRFWGARTYRINEIAAIALRKASKDDDDPLFAEIHGTLTIKFTDGRQVKAAVPTHKTEQVIAVLAAAGVKSAAGASA